MALFCGACVIGTWILICLNLLMWDDVSSYAGCVRELLLCKFLSVVVRV